MSERVLTDAEIAAVNVGWTLAHNEACRLGPYCSAHQPVSASAQRPRVINALLADSRFMAIKDHADWPTTPTTETREDSRSGDRGAKPPSRGSVMRSAGESES